MNIISQLINNLPVLFGISLVAAGLGGRTAIVTGVVLIVLGLLL